MNRRQFLIGAAAAGVALAAGRPPHARGGGNPLVLVTADTESHVAVLRAATGEVVRRIRTPRIPRSIEGVGGTAVVAHSEIGRVSLIDLATARVRELVGRVDEPRYAAAHPDGRHAYLSDSALEAVIVIDVVRGRVVRRIGVGGPARHLGIDRAGRRLWTALGSTAAEVAVLDVRDAVHPRLVRRLRPPYLAHDVVFAPDGRVWVSSGDRGVVGIYDPASRRLLRRIPAGSPPQHIAFGASVAYVTSGDDGTLRVHRLDGRLLRTTSIPVGSFNVSPGLGMVVAPSLTRGTLCLLDRHGRRRWTTDVAAAAHDACLVMGGAAFD